MLSTLKDQQMQKPEDRGKKQGLKPHSLELGKQGLYQQTSPLLLHDFMMGPGDRMFVCKLSPHLSLIAGSCHLLHYLGQRQEPRRCSGKD